MRILGLRYLARLPGNSSGFALLEVAVAMTLLTFAIGLVGTSVFQVLSGAEYWQSDVKATKDLRHAGSWFAGDVMSNSKSTDLVDGASAVSSVMFTTFTDDEITYSIAGNDLIRTFDDGVSVAQTTLSKQVVSVNFSLTGDVVTFSLELPAAHGNTETITLNTHLR